MTKFVPMYDLDTLSEEQKKQYYLSACNYLGVPPELNVLSFHFMDQGDGARKLVLYAKKGATDIIRNNLGISVIGLTKEVGNGEVTWVATGKNKEGRTEMSSGSKSIDGLRGRSLESAIMWAQTKALRRMTLQFAGGGILDETEIESATTDINLAPSLSQIETKSNPVPQPVVQPNAAPGKDVTATEPVAEQPKRRKREVTFDKPFALTPIADNPWKELDKGPGCPAMPAGAGETWIAPGTKQLDITPEQKQAATEIAYKAGQEVGKIIVEAEKQTNYPDPKQVSVYRDKLFVYANEILPNAGMQPSEIGGGSAMKMKKFVAKRYNVKQLNTEQWEDLFNFLDTTMKEKGAAALVKIIDDVADAQ